MRKTILTLVMTALVLGPLSASFAYAHGPDGPRSERGSRWDGGSRGEGGRHWDGGPRGEGGPGWDRGRGPGPRWDNGPRGGWGRYDDRREHFRSRGYDFRYGHPIPGPYRGDRYWVRDWRGYGLPSPPRGHQWRYVDGNYVLIAVATGVITAILLNQAFN